MVVWWSVFAYMIIISGIGMKIYKNKKQTDLGPVDDSSAKNYKSIGLFFALLSFVLLAYFTGQRSWIFDTFEYQYAYENTFKGEFSEITDIINGTSDVKGPLYCILLILFKGLTHGTYNDWFTFVAIIQCLALALLFYKYSVNFTFSVFLFFTSSCFLWLLNGMRQFLAATIILYFFDWIVKRRTIPFLIVVICLYFIHSSAIFWIPVYFIVNFKPWSKKHVTLTVLLIAALYLVSKSSALQDTDYAYINSSDSGVNPFRVIVMSLPAILSLIYRKDISTIDDNIYNIIINISVVCSGCFIAGMITNGFVARIAVYFQLFIYLLLPWLLKEVVNEYVSKTMTIACIIGFIAYFCYDMYVAGNGIYQSANLSIY